MGKVAYEIKTIKDLVTRAASKYQNRIAYRYMRKKEIIEKSYEQVKKDCDAFGSTLSKLGMIGKHIAIIGPTSYEYLIAYLGAASSGSVVVPIDKELPQEEVIDLLNRADISVLVYDEQYASLLDIAKEKCKAIEYFIHMTKEQSDEAELSLLNCLEENQGSYENEIAPESLCAILYTSGTTGKSKGVMLSHKNLIHNVLCGDMKVPDESVILTVLPIHHAYCFNCDILLGLYNGCTVCINDSMMHLVRNLKRFAPNIILLVPMILESMYYKLNEASKASPEIPKPMIAQAALGGKLKVIYCGGAYLNPKLIKAFREFGIQVLQGYGMTESAPRISCNYSWLSKDESVGQLLQGVEAKVVEGEIWVKSDSVMMGYYHNPEATEETLVDGWLKTGDLGYIDEERFVYISGRKKNLIILSNGENVSAEEIENKLYEAPLISEVLVYGENNLITAEIYPNEEYKDEQGITDCKEALQQIIDQVNQKVPSYKHIHTLKIRNTAFEKTTSKKIKRNKL